MKKLCYVFIGLAIVLSDLMCVIVTYNYCSLLWCAACSAPASTAFLTGIPFLMGIVLCVILAVIFHRKCQKTHGT